MSLSEAIIARRTYGELGRTIPEDTQFQALIDIGNGSHRCDCTVLNVSEHGARIEVASAATLPEEFWLVLRKDVTMRRRCRIIYRSDSQIGVTYLGPLQAEPVAANGPA